MKRVAIVVLNWNGWQDTINCLQSLQRLDYSDAEIYCVDNASTDDSVAQIRVVMPHIRLIETGCNLGFGGGCNAGIRCALKDAADYFWLINSDATVDVGSLTSMVHCAEADPSIGIVGSVVHEMSQPSHVQLWGGGRVNLWLGGSHHRTTPGEIDFVSGASMLIRRSALEQVGLFDQETFFMFWEDTDLCFRMRAAGWLLAVASDSRVFHRQTASLAGDGLLLDRYFTQSCVRFLKRYSPTPNISIVLMLCSRALKRLLKGQFRRGMEVVMGVIRG